MALRGPTHGGSIRKIAQENIVEKLDKDSNRPRTGLFPWARSACWLGLGEFNSRSGGRKTNLPGAVWDLGEKELGFNKRKTGTHCTPFFLRCGSAGRGEDIRLKNRD